MSRSGIYALINLDGAAIRPADAAILGLTPANGPIAANGLDAIQPNAVHVDRGPDRVTVFVGFLDEAAELAESLKMPGKGSPIALVRAAIARHGAEAARVVRGEWSFLDWSRAGEVVLMSSIIRRDPILYARSGSTIAIAPDLDRLASLGWIDRAIDATGLLFAVGRGELRQSKSASTMLAGVGQVQNGSTVHLDRSSEKMERIEPFTAVTPFRGSFEEAMEETDHLLHAIVRQRLSRADGAACLLSGGLNSSLVALLAASERRPVQRLICLSSAAPEMTGLPDETPFAQIVADRLDLPMEGVAPPEYPSIYRPLEVHMLAANGPPTSVRHYLYDALFARAEQLSIPLVLDGCFGEMTVTAKMPLITTAVRMRRLVRHLIGRKNSVNTGPTPFHARLAPHRLANLPDAVTNALSTANRNLTERSPHQRWGYLSGAEKMLDIPTDLWQGRVRVDYPFRHLRLLELFASFPAHFARHERVRRAPVRHIMKGRLPDSIRLRPRGLPISPDYELRLRTHADAALERLPLFRAADLDDWLDLDWLERQLGVFKAHGPSSVLDAFETQLTATTAEYLLWWQVRA